VAALIIISQIENKLKFMEATNTYTFEIQQARRFEKNFFLYGTNLIDALDHVHKARQILSSNGDKIEYVVGRKNFETMVAHVDRYEELLARLPTLQKSATDNGSQPSLETIEAERSKRIVSNLLDFARKSEIKSEPLNIERLICHPIYPLSTETGSG